MKKALEFMKCRKIVLIVIIVCISLALYFFIPRQLSKLCLNSNIDTLTSVTVYCMPDGAEKEKEEYTFTGQKEVDAFKELLQSCYIRPKIFNVEYVNGGYEGYYFFFEENATPNNKTVFLFTSDIITINGRQFVLYNNDFSAKLKKCCMSDL